MLHYSVQAFSLVFLGPSIRQVTFPIQHQDQHISQMNDWWARLTKDRAIQKYEQQPLFLLCMLAVLLLARSGYCKCTNSKKDQRANEQKYFSIKIPETITGTQSVALGICSHAWLSVEEDKGLAVEGERGRRATRLIKFPDQAEWLLWWPTKALVKAPVPYVADDGEGTCVHSFSVPACSSTPWRWSLTASLSFPVYYYGALSSMHYYWLCV